MQIRKFEVDKPTIDFYIAQIQQVCNDLQEDYFLAYQSVHKVIWDSVMNVLEYRKGADIDILSNLKYTLNTIEKAYLDALELDELSLDIIIINKDSKE